jgi:signal transduction histidine kinase
MADALLRGLDVGVVMLDPDGRVAEINAAAARMLELVPARARGLEAGSLIHTVVPGQDPVRDAFRARGGECEVVLRTGSDGELPVLLQARRLGRPAWTLLVLRDLTQARRMQQELRRHERLMTLGQLAAGVAHEIRNPIQVEVDVASRLGPVYIDPDLITQVLLNVTLNAIQALGQEGRGSRRLRYELRQVRRRSPARGPGRRASDTAGLPGPSPFRTASGFHTYQQVRVIDDGPGIPRGVLDKLFDPFFSTKPRGTGLGLSISQTIMQEHGGSIAIASREGRGTTVLLNFPVEKRHGQRRHPDADAVRPDAAHR